MTLDPSRPIICNQSIVPTLRQPKAAPIGVAFLLPGRRMMQPLQSEPSLRQAHPALFSVSDWHDIIKPRRRRCPKCGAYVWLDLDRTTGRDVLACSACGWED